MLAASFARKRSSKFSAQQYSDQPGTDKKRSRKATANRILTVFKAILNKAFQDEMVNDDLPWQRVKPFEKVHEDKVRFLTEYGATRLINACDLNLRQLVQAALYTGAKCNDKGSGCTAYWKT